MNMIKNRIFYFFLIAVSIWGAYKTWSFPTVGTIGAEFFPRIVFGGIILFSIAATFLDIHQDNSKYAKSVVVVSVLILATVLLLQYSNFMVGVFAFLLSYMKIIGHRGWKSSLIISAVGVACLMVPIYFLHIPI